MAYAARMYKAKSLDFAVRCLARLPRVVSRAMAPACFMQAIGMGGIRRLSAEAALFLVENILTETNLWNTQLSWRTGCSTGLLSLYLLCYVAE